MLVCRGERVKGNGTLSKETALSKLFNLPSEKRPLLKRREFVPQFYVIRL